MKIFELVDCLLYVGRSLEMIQAINGILYPSNRLFVRPMSSSDTTTRGGVLGLGMNCVVLLLNPPSTCHSTMFGTFEPT